MMQADEDKAKLSNSDTCSECKNKEILEKEHEATTTPSENSACDKDMMQREENQTNIDNTTTSPEETNDPTSDIAENNEFKEATTNLSENTSNNDQAETENTEEKCSEKITFQEHSSGEKCEKMEETASGPIAESKTTNQQACSNANRNRTDKNENKRRTKNIKDNTNTYTSKRKDLHNDTNCSNKDKKDKGNIRTNRFGNKYEKAKGKVDSKYPANTDCTDEFVFFWKSHSPYSQWYLGNFIVDGREFNCAEQYMMYAKAMLFNDDKTAAEILEEKDPRNHKSLGRRVQNFDQIKWDEKCLDIVKQGNKAKFSQNEELYKIITDSHPKTLVEASPMDKIWGIGLASNDFRARDRKKWRGKNLLGKALTEVREELITENSRKKEISTTGMGSMACSMPETRESTKEDIINEDTAKENTAEHTTDLSGTAENNIDTTENNIEIGTTENNTEIGTTENSIEIGTTETSTEIGTTENSIEIGTTGNSTEIGTTENSIEIGTTENSIEIGTTENNIEIGTTENSIEIGITEESADKTCTAETTECTIENNAKDAAINESTTTNKTDDVKEVTPQQNTDSADDKATEPATNDTKECVTSRRNRRLLTDN